MPALNTPILSGEQIERLTIYRQAGAFAPKGKSVPHRVADKAQHQANEAWKAYTSWRDACELLMRQGRTLSDSSVTKLRELKAIWDARQSRADQLDRQRPIY